MYLLYHMHVYSIYTAISSNLSICLQNCPYQRLKQSILCKSHSKNGPLPKIIVSLMLCTKTHLKQCDILQQEHFLKKHPFWLYLPCIASSNYKVPGKNYAIREKKYFSYIMFHYMPNILQQLLQPEYIYKEHPFWLFSAFKTTNN